MAGVAALGLAASCGAADDTAGNGDGHATTGSATDDGTGGATPASTSSTASDSTSSTASDSGETADSGTADTSAEDSDTDGPVLPDGYEGYGAMTMGADSCPRAPDEVHVTSLEDSGPGTLRAALDGGCRRVVFDLGGTIELASDLNLPHSYVTIDGATAPEPGITIAQPSTIGTTIEASGSIGPVHDIIISHLRMDGMAADHENEGDIWGLDGEAAPVSNVIIDHVTAIASTDGAFDMWEDVTNVTISWCLILDTVTALHLSTGDVDVSRDRISFHHNVLSGNNERQIRVRHATTDLDYRYNVVHGWGWFEGGAAGLHIAYDDGESNPSLNVVGNAFLHVASTAGGEDDAIVFERGADEGVVFFSDNRLPAGELDAVSTGDELVVPDWATVTPTTQDELASSVTSAGTHHPTASETMRLQAIAELL